MGAKSRAIAEDVLDCFLDGVAATAVSTSALRVRLGTGTPSTTTGQLTSYSSELGEAQFQATTTDGGNWTIADADSGTGSKATNGKVVGNGSTQWNNSTGSTIAVTEIGIYKATGGAAADLLYSGSVSSTNVGAGATVTIAASGLVITEQ
jgi:hypothetical protein